MPSRRSEASEIRCCQMLEPSAATRATIVAASSSFAISPSWPSPSPPEASILAARVLGGDHFEPAVRSELTFDRRFRLSDVRARLEIDAKGGERGGGEGSRVVAGCS